MTQKEKKYTFSGEVKKSVYKRGGGRCAFKDCAKHLTSIKNNCEIAHIYPASNGGPRSEFIKEHGIDGGFRGSEKNGILMCPDHASLIDKDGGKDYPPAILFDWKNVIELTNELIAHNPKIQRYEQELSVPNIISVVRKEYDANKKNRAIDLNKAIEEKLNHLYNERIANERKISELEYKPNTLSSEVKQLINEKKEAQRLNNEINQQASYSLLEIIKNLPRVQLNLEGITKDTILVMTDEPLNLTISLNDKSFKFIGLKYSAIFRHRKVVAFEITPNLPFLDMHLTIKDSKLEKIDCKITKRIGEFFRVPKYKENLKTFINMFQGAKNFQQPITAAVTFQFKALSVSTTFITKIHSGIEAPDQFLGVAKEILHCVEAGYQDTFHHLIYTPLLHETLMPEEFRKIYNFLYEKPIKPGETMLELKNYNCVINRSRFGINPERLKVREISSKINNTNNIENAKPALLIEI